MEQENITNDNQVKSEEEKLEMKRLEDYKGLEGISTKELTWGLWYIEHKKKIKAGVVILLIIISALLWVYSIYGIVDYYARGVLDDERNIYEIAQTSIDHAMVKAMSSQSLAFSAVSTVINSSGKYDFLVEAQNVNYNYIANFDYCFTVSNQEIGCGSSFILPRERKYIIAFNNQSPGQPTFTLKKVNWQAIDKHSIPNWSEYEKARINFTITKAKITSLLSSDQNSVGYDLLSFNITNNTAFNYFEVPLNIIIYSGSRIASLGRYYVSDFLSQESRDISINWPNNISGVSDIEIQPDLNILDSSIYKKFEGGIGEPK